MRVLDYAFREGWRSLRRDRGATVSAIVAIALAMLVLGALLLLTTNLERLIARWTSAAEFSVFLSDEATSEQRGAIEAAIDQSGVAAGREYVSKTQAFERFRRQFAELAPIAAGFDANPFPASVEVRVRPDAERDGRAGGVVQRLGALPGVADVRYDQEWIARVSGGLSAVRGAGVGLAMLMGLAAAMTVASVVRLGLYARREEVELMQLVGAPVAFIRGPFVAQGLLQGGIGAGLALLLLWLAFSGCVVWWGSALEGLFEGSAPAFLPARMLVGLVGGGMLVGGLGGLVASRHAV